MTAPKMQLAGQVTNMCRRTSQGQFLLRPDRDKQYQNDLGYIYCYAAIKHDQDLHAVMFMSNHVHCNTTDKSAKRSDFMRETNHFVTKITNQRFENRSETIWSSHGPKDQTLLCRQKAEQKIIYNTLNPVQAGLVESVKQWAHFKITPYEWGTTLTFTRPDFFTDHDKFPETISYIPTAPAAFDHMPLYEAKSYFIQRIEKSEEIIRIAKGKFIGMDAVFDTDILSYAPHPPKKQSDRLFCHSNPIKQDLANEAYTQYQLDYAQALHRFKADINTVFPAGTLNMRRHLNVSCLPPDIHSPLYPSYPLRTCDLDFVSDA